MKILELTKPRLVILVLFTMTAGMLLAPGSMAPDTMIISLLATACIVAACGCLNMVIEKDLDGRMERTRHRPLPSGRVRSGTALFIGLLLLVIAFPILLATTNPLTAALGVGATGLYLCAYTPLKTRSHAALYIGALAGATPIVMGTSAVTGSVNELGLSLFLILYTWQLQHFLSIALRYEEDYRKAGIKIYPLTVGRNRTRLHMILFCLFFWIAILTPLWATNAGGIYFIVACTIGLSLTILSLLSKRNPLLIDIERRHFLGALAALPLLFAVLVADANFINSYWPRLQNEATDTLYVQPLQRDASKRAAESRE